MSFSREVKNELAEHVDKARHCQLAELAAIISHEARVCVRDGETRLEFQSDNPLTQKKYFTLLAKTTTIDSNELDLGQADAKEVLTTVKMWKGQNADQPLCMDVVDGLLLQQTCCKRAYIRGAFLAAGSISDPNKSYHFEIVCRTQEQGEQLQQVMMDFGVDAKIVERKKHYVVYLKEGAQIVDMLNVMGAHVALMNLENVRILKEMRNSVNRKVNCETANISKTVNAAVRQVEDIQLIVEKQGMSSLPENLQEIARVRMENPDMPLKELGALLTPPIGKSGVNHRLRRIGEIADRLRV
ncbi:MAG: DNA-binding protein WhiA [Lachnospiraceae bacterium]|nr:DNA-binding protein WhiA [Lachnospiraceae bacterium]MDD6192856.1 DNA-binding protein WhiA [Lachnospiraceae bacterium]MDY4792963.1 DNA-binding protein WhiA [Pararoseburia sp.]